jgi:polysaccharide pyruvyl transferase WcaK-like protein
LYDELFLVSIGFDVENSIPMIPGSMSKPRIALLAPFSYGNLGNAALQRTLIECLQKTFPNAEFLGCYVDPTAQESPVVTPFPFHRGVPRLFAPNAARIMDTPLQLPPSLPSGFRNRFKSVPGLRLLVQFLRALLQGFTHFLSEIVFLWRARHVARSIDLFIVGGGGQLDDLWGGPLALPYSLATWAFLAKRYRKPFLILSVGAEATNSALGRWLLRQTLRLASYRSYRDHESQRKAVSLGGPESDPVFPDLAFGLDVTHFTPPNSPTQRVIGISPMSYGDPRVWPLHRPELFENYRQSLCEFIACLLERGHRLVLFPTQIRMDKTLIEEIDDTVRQRISVELSRNLTLACIKNLDDGLSLISQLDFVVASRFHGVLLPLRIGVPVMALSSESKVKNLMAQMDLSDYLLDLETVSLSHLSQLFSRLLLSRESIQAHCQNKDLLMRVRLHEQCNEVSERFLGGLISLYGAGTKPLAGKRG